MKGGGGEGIVVEFEGGAYFAFIDYYLDTERFEVKAITTLSPSGDTKLLVWRIVQTVRGVLRRYGPSDDFKELDNFSDGFSIEYEPKYAKKNLMRQLSNIFTAKNSLGAVRAAVGIKD